MVGRLIPTASNPSPPALRMRLFAVNKVLAESRFWHLLRKLRKIKKAHGEILEISEIKEKRGTYVKNFGIWLRYDSRTGTHNMYKEVRDLTQNGAISQIYAEMAGRHRALASSIQVSAIFNLNLLTVDFLLCLLCYSESTVFLYCLFRLYLPLLHTHLFCLLCLFSFSFTAVFDLMHLISLLRCSL